MRPRNVDRALAIVFGAYGIGLAGVMLGIMVWDAHTVVASSVGLIILALAYARLAFRCPVCRAAVFLTPVTQAIPWVTGRSRRCPRCRTDYHEALRELARPTRPEPTSSRPAP
jgi:hypothetical protein